MANDKKQHYKTVSKTCYTANITYLILHIVYLVLFIIAKTKISIIVDAVAIILYLFFFYLIKKKKYYLYALLCGNEFFAFIAINTIVLGFSTGFHFYLIGLCIVSFFTSYFSKTKDIRGSIVWVGLSLTIYLTLYFVTKYREPYYAVDAWLEMILFTIHAILVFGFIAGYLVVFLKYALSLEKRIMSESRTDELTRISNRYGLYDYFDEEDDDAPKMLALFDIDNFKNINDMYGHVTGDCILKKLAEITVQVLSDSFVCRYGGEEFIVVLKDNGKESFYNRLELLRQTVENEVFEIADVKTNVTITIGAVIYNKDETLEKMIEIADQKMYSGKKKGKNRTII